MMTEKQSDRVNRYIKVGYRVSDYIGGTVVMVLEKYGRVSTVEVKSSGDSTMTSRKAI